MTTVAANPNPYAYMGNDVSGLTDIDEMLASGGAAFTAVAAPLTATTPNGVSPADGYVGIIRDDTDEVLHVARQGYKTIQYREVVEIALEASGLLAADAPIRDLGTIDNGKQFFLTVDLGSLFLDPNGANDEIQRYLAGFSSHNGSLSVMFTETNLRVICSNQASAIASNSRERRSLIYRVKHTRNATERLVAAKDALGIADRAAKLFADQAATLFGMAATKDLVVSTAEKVWGKPDADASDRAKTEHGKRTDKLVELYEGPTCVGSVGANRWAAYNAFTEYLDHGRGTSPEKRAAASVLPEGWVSDRKNQAGAILLGV